VVPELSIFDGAMALTDVRLNVFGTQAAAESHLRTYIFYSATGGGGGGGGTYRMTNCSSSDVAEEEEGFCMPSPPPPPSRRRSLLSASQPERWSGPWGAHSDSRSKWNAGADPDSHAASARLGGDVDTYGIKKECEAKERCVGFKLSSGGCVTFLLSTDSLHWCRKASVELDYGGFKPEAGGATAASTPHLRVA